MQTNTSQQTGQEPVENPFIQREQALQRLRAEDLFSRISTGELDINDGETQDMIAVQFCRMQNLGAAQLFNGDDYARQLSNGRFGNRRELGLAVYSMWDTANKLDLAHRKEMDAAMATGDRSQIVAACNKACFGNDVGKHRNDWTDDEISAVQRSALNRDTMFSVLGRSFDKLKPEGRMGLVGAILMSSGCDAEDLVEGGIYDKLTPDEQVSAMLLTNLLRAGRESGVLDAITQTANFFNTPAAILRGGMLALGPGDAAKANRMLELYEKHGGDMEALINDPKARTEAVSEMESMTTPFKFWTDDEIRNEASRWIKLGKQDRLRRKIQHSATQILGDPKYVDTSEAMKYAIEAIGVTFDMAGQFASQMGVYAASLFLTKNPLVSGAITSSVLGLAAYEDTVNSALVKGRSWDDANILGVAVGAAQGAVEMISGRIQAPVTFSKLGNSIAQKTLAKRGADLFKKGVVKGTKRVSDDIAKIASFKGGIMKRVAGGFGKWTKNWGIESAEEILQEAITSGLELSSDYWSEDGVDAYNLGDELEEIKETAIFMAKYGFFASLPANISESMASRRKIAGSKIAGVAPTQSGKIKTIRKGVSLVDATNAEIAVQAYQDAKQQARIANVPHRAIESWKPDMTAEQREDLQKKFKLSDEQVSTLDAMNYYEKLASGLGDESIEIERNIVEFNRHVDNLSKEDIVEITADFKEQMGAEEANAATKTPQNGDAEGNTTTPSSVKFSAGNLLAPTREVSEKIRKVSKMRDKVLSQIAKKAGIKIVKESAEAIKRSAGKADGGRFSYSMPPKRRNKYDNWRIMPDEYSALSSQIANEWYGKREVDVYYSKDARAVYLVKRGKSVRDAFDIVDVFSVELSQDEFEARREQFLQELDDAKEESGHGAVGAYQYVFGKHFSSTSSTENGGTNATLGGLDGRGVGADRQVPQSRRGDGAGVLYYDTKEEDILAYVVDGPFAKKGRDAYRKHQEAKNGKLPKGTSLLGLQFKAESAFHGSPHNFAAEENAPLGRFRDDKMGSGEGAQAFGWGHYLTSEDGIGRRYANELAARKHAGVASLIVLEQIQGQLDQGGIWQLYGKDGMLRKAQLEKPDDVSEGWKFVPLTAESRKYFEQQKTTVEKELAMFEAKGVDVRNRRHLYTAEFDDATLLDWVAPLTKEQQLRIAAQMREEGLVEEADALADDANHGTLYNAKEFHNIDGILGLKSPKERSKLLFRAGFVGHKFPAASHGAGNYSKGTNYVIYDESALRIASKVSWLQYQGTIYGYYDPAKKELHLNEEVVDLDTPIHEWTHIWWAWLKGEDPRMIERIVELMKQTKEFKTLKGQWLRDKDSVYHGMTDEGIAEEVFARFVGARGEDILVREGVGTWARIRRCVLDFFKKVFRTLGLSQDEIDNLTFEDVQNMCLRDLLDNETLGIKGLRAKISQRTVLLDAIDTATMDWSIEDATRKRHIRNASVLIAAKMVARYGKLSPSEVESKRSDIIAEAQKILSEEDGFTHEAVADVVSLYAKMVYSTRKNVEDAIAAEAVNDVVLAAKTLRSERILNAAYKRGVVGAELYAEAKEYVDRYTKMTKTGRGSTAQPLSWDEVAAKFGGASSLISALLDQEKNHEVSEQILEMVSQKLGLNAKSWDILNATRKTLASVYKRASKTWVHSAFREQALRAASLIEDADSLDVVMKRAKKFEQMFKEKGIKLTLKSLSEQIDEFTKRVYKRTGDKTQQTDKRRYSPAFMAFIEQFREGFALMSEQAKLLEKIRSSETVGNPDVSEQIANIMDKADAIRQKLNEKVRSIVENLERTDESTVAAQALQAQLQAINLLVQTDFFSVESMSALLDTLKMAEDQDAEMKFAQTSRFVEQVDVDAKKLADAANSRGDMRKYDQEAGAMRKTFGWLTKYMFGMKQHFDDVTRHATGDTRNRAQLTIKRIHSQERSANLRKEKELLRRKTLFRQFLAIEMGLKTDADVRKFSKKLKEKHESLSRFSLDGAPMTYDQLLNVYLGVRQKHVSGMLLEMSAKERDAYFNKRPDARRLWKQISQMSEMRAVLEKADLLKYGDGLCRMLNDERLRVNEACAEFFGNPLMTFADDPHYFPIHRESTSPTLNTGGGKTANVVPSAVLPRIANTRALDEFPCATSAFLAQIDEVEHFIAYGKLSRYMTHLFANADFVRAVKNKYGSEAFTKLRNSAADTINGQYYNNDDIGSSTMVNGWTNITSVLFLGFNIGTALKQISSFLMFANEIGWKKTFYGITFSDDDKSKLALIKEMMNHPLWHARYQGAVSQKHISDLMNFGESKVGDIWKRYAELSMMTVRAGDAAAVLIVGHGIYGATKARLMRQLNPVTGKLYTEEEATDIAMASVMDLADRTQQASRTATFNDTQRRGSATARFIGLFQSSLGQMTASEVRAFKDVVARRNKESVEKLTTVMVNNHVIVPAFSMAATLLIKALFKGELPDEDDRDDMILSAILGPFGGLYLFGGLLTTGFSTSDYADVSYPSVSLLRRLGTSGFKFAASLADGEDNTTPKAATRLLRSTAVTRQVVNLIDTWLTDTDGKE